MKTEKDKSAPELTYAFLTVLEGSTKIKQKNKPQSQICDKKTVRTITE